MSRRTSTPTHASRRRAERELESTAAAAGERPGWQRRWYLDAAAAAVLVAAVTVWKAQAATGGLGLMTATAAALFGGLVGAGMLAHRWVGARLGNLTALAVLALTGAAVCAVGAAAPSSCPGATVDLGRCGPQEVAQWAGTGLLLPVVLALVIALPYAAVATGRRTWAVLGAIHRWLTRRPGAVTHRAGSSANDAGSSPTQSKTAARTRPSRRPVGERARKPRRGTGG